MGNCFRQRDENSKAEKASDGHQNNNSYLTSTALNSTSGTTTSQVSNSTASNLTAPSSWNDSQWGNSSTPSIICNKSSQLGDSIPSSHLHSFTYNELKGVTKNFRTDNLLGEGGFGSVFKGWMDEQSYTAARPGVGIVVAVKKLNPQSLQGHKEWLTEVHYLGQLHHPNLVKLIGYCGKDEHRLLVYEFMPRGSLENHLFRRGASIPWTVRMKIALGAAKGLGFLHAEQVIYRDFKTSNILLDYEYNAKLSDFGLAREGPTGNNTHVSTKVVGTLGYAAPEYVATGRLTMRCDIYSFGVVLLEIITGRRAYDKTRPLEEQELVEWGRPYLSNKKKVYRLMDPRLDGQCSRIGFERASNLAYNCLHTDEKTRPSMKEVVEILERLVNPRETMARPPHPLPVPHPHPHPSSRLSQR